MIVVTGFSHPDTPEWDQKLENLAKSSKFAGHGVLRHYLPTNDPWIASVPEVYLSICWKYKILFMIESIENLWDDFVWVDGDCLITRNLEPDKVFKDCDVAFTLRDIKDRKDTDYPVRDGLINSGVVFVKKNEASKNFFIEVRNELDRSKYDQEAINRVLLRHSDLSEYGEIININGARVKILNCREYNNFYFDESAKEAKILHFKGSGRQRYNDYLTKGVV